MSRTCRFNPWLAAAGVLLLGSVLRAQEPAAESLPNPTPLAQQYPAYALPDPGWPAVDCGGIDPLLDRPNAAQPGYYANVEVNPLFVQLRNQLSSPLNNPVKGTTDTVEFPGNRLNTTVSPRVELGYRLPDNWGGCQVGYTSIASRGTDVTFTGIQPQNGFTSDTFMGFASQVGRLDLNMFDLTYVSREFIIGPQWNFRAGVGVRYIGSFFDSRIQFLAPATAPGSILAQGQNNRNSGIGVWGFIDVERELFGIPNLYFFGRVEGTDTFSRISQTYSEQIINAAGTGAQLLQVQYGGSVGLSAMRGIAGLSYQVPRWNYTRLMIGYQYGTFFQLGRLSNIENGIPDTRGQLNIQGLLLRAEINF